MLGGLGGNLGGRSLEPTLETSEGARRVLLTDNEDCLGARDGRFCCGKADGAGVLPLLPAGSFDAVSVDPGVPGVESLVLLTEIDDFLGGKHGLSCGAWEEAADDGVLAFPG